MKPRSGNCYPCSDHIQVRLLLWAYCGVANENYSETAVGSGYGKCKSERTCTASCNRTTVEVNVFLGIIQGAISEIYLKARLLTYQHADQILSSPQQDLTLFLKVLVHS